MYLYIHFLTSIVLAAALYPFIGFYSLWAIVGGYLIDADHYLWTIYRCKNWGIKFSYDYYDERHRGTCEKDILHIFHTVEFWLFMILAAGVSYILGWTFFFYMFAITFIGIVLHVALDTFDLVKDKRMDVRAISWLKWLKRHKNP